MRFEYQLAILFGGITLLAAANYLGGRKVSLRRWGVSACVYLGTGGALAWWAQKPLLGLWELLLLLVYCQCVVWKKLIDYDHPHSRVLLNRERTETIFLWLFYAAVSAAIVASGYDRHFVLPIVVLAYWFVLLPDLLFGQRVVGEPAPDGELER